MITLIYQFNIVSTEDYQMVKVLRPATTIMYYKMNDYLDLPIVYNYVSSDFD